MKMTKNIQPYIPQSPMSRCMNTCDLIQACIKLRVIFAKFRPKYLDEKDIMLDLVHFRYLYIKEVQKFNVH